MTTQTKIEQAVEWLADYLDAQPKRTALSSQCVADAEAAGFAYRMVQRARTRLGVTTTSGSLPGRPFVTYWTLPGEPVSAGLSHQDQADALEFVQYVMAGELAGAQAVLRTCRPPQMTTALGLMFGFVVEQYSSDANAALGALRKVDFFGQGDLK